MHITAKQIMLITGKMLSPEAITKRQRKHLLSSQMRASCTVAC